MHTKTTITLLAAFAIIMIIVRLIPHPANFVPIGSLILFAGFLAPRRFIWLPLAALVATDLAIGSYDRGVMSAVYASYASMFIAAHALRERYTFGNAAVWQFSGMYSHDVAGLFASYGAGIPFFRNTLAAYVAFSAAFFGAYELVRAKMRIPKPLQSAESAGR